MPISIAQYDWSAPWVGGTDVVNYGPLSTGIADFNPVGSWNVGARPASVKANVSSVVSRSVTVTVYDTAAAVIGNVTVTNPVGNSMVLVPLTFGANDLIRLRVALTPTNNANDFYVDSIDVAGIAPVGFCFWVASPGEAENC